MENFHFTYFDFGTATASGSGNYLEDEEKYPISYCLIVAFHPKLDIERIVVFSSFQQTLDKLNDISYLNRNMIEEVDLITTNQLRDCIIKVFKKKINLQFLNCFLVN